ncbi:hypothetical protein MtrunA17_Chr3g0101451 [Medicago truncatula]|uniref:Transmembrane protein n=1 Tax=Medicago truncatula TaxID=3880 RepID=A0A396ISG8_MEDTR|nr:hypothetical protein MtrunA17_Chr3g0101451 [Medicago truncatula]
MFRLLIIVLFFVVVGKSIRREALELWQKNVAFEININTTFPFSNYHSYVSHSLHHSLSCAHRTQLSL